MDNFDLKKYLVENKVTTNSRMLNEQTDSIPAAIQETGRLLKKEGIPFTMVTEKEMEDELQHGVDPGVDTTKSVIKLKGSKGNVYIAEFGYGSISVDAKDIDENYPEFWQELGEGEYATDSGKDIIRVLRKYFMKDTSSSRMMKEAEGLNFNQEAAQFPKLVRQYGEEAVAEALEAIYINAEDASEMSGEDAEDLYMNQVDSFKQDPTELIDIIKDNR